MPTITVCLTVHTETRMPTVRSLLAPLIGSALLASSAQGQSIATQYETGTAYTTTSLTGFSTSGAAMAGMLVTARFASGDVFQGTWGNLGTQVYGGASFSAYGVSGLWGSLAFPTAGDSNDNFWFLRLASGDYGALLELTLNGAPGRTLFDCRFTTSGCDNFAGTLVNGTPGSSGAIAAQVATTNQFLAQIGSHNLFDASDVLGVYSNSVSLTGNPPVGDLFEQFSLRFDGGMTVDQGLFLFAVDTDNAAVGAVIVPTTPVPEPSSLVLLVGALGGLALAARRRRVV